MDKLTRNMNVPLTEKQYQGMQAIAEIESKKAVYGKVTTAQLLRRLIADFIQNYNFKEND